MSFLPLGQQGQLFDLDTQNLIRQCQTSSKRRTVNLPGYRENAEKVTTNVFAGRQHEEFKITQPITYNEVRRNMMRDDR